MKRSKTEYFSQWIYCNIIISIALVFNLYPTNIVNNFWFSWIRYKQLWWYNNINPLSLYRLSKQTVEYIGIYSVDIHRKQWHVFRSFSLSHFPSNQKIYYPLWLYTDRFSSLCMLYVVYGIIIINTQQSNCWWSKRNEHKTSVASLAQPTTQSLSEILFSTKHSQVPCELSATAVASDSYQI